MSGERAVAGGSRAVAVWLWLLVGLVLAMASVGAATRLTGSGLSITEWRPVTGAVPPLSDADWASEFAKYRDSPQYEILNEGMDLAAFRSIYWWEWGHRQLGRLIGLVFFLPLVAFWWRGRLSGRRAAALLGVGALGGLQAGVGWIMVASGLEPGMVAVAPVKLTLHLLVASLILSLLTAAAVQASGVATGRVDRPAGRGWARLLLALVIVQIALGGLVAGSKAGLAYNTWPLMDGRLVPPAETLFAGRVLLENAVDNPALVQFDHRLGAYLVVALALWNALLLRLRAPGAPEARRASLVAGLALAQTALGIATLLLAVPLWAGLAHQALALCLLVAATADVAAGVRRRSPERRERMSATAPAGLAPAGGPR